VHCRALECLVKELRKKKYAETDQPRKPRQPVERSTRRNDRHIPAEVRRRVAERDGKRCTYTSPTGERCRETRLLEFDHVEAFAKGGPPSEANLRLRCRAHNTLAAEEDFGRDFIREKQGLWDPRQRGESDSRADLHVQELGP
jgi:hypothetical protein